MKKILLKLVPISFVSFFIHAHNDINSVVTRQSDQKIIAAGTIEIDESNHFLIARYNNDGSLDTSLNSTGFITPIVGSNCSVNIVLDSADNLVIGGTCDQAFIVARYTSSGLADTTFGQEAGHTTTAIGEQCEIKGLLIEPDGKLIAAGFSMANGKMRCALAKYLANGTLDTSFGTSGTLVATPGFHSSAHAIARQTDGKIIIAGWAHFGGSEQVVLIRFNTDGTTDTSFGSSGTIITQIGLMSHANALVVQSDGKIVIAGNSDNKFMLARYTSTGALDTTFGTNGIVTTSLGNHIESTSITLLPDGTMIVGGCSDAGAVIAHYTSAGALNTSFGTNGISKTFVSQETKWNAITTQTNTIIAAGCASGGPVIASFNASTGIRNASFGDNGIVREPGLTSSEKTIITYCWDQKTTGNAGGSFYALAWQTRDLNKIAGESGNVSLQNNTITLKPGVYELNIQAPAFAVDNHKLRLYNVTNDFQEKVGLNANASSISLVSTTASCQCLIYVSSQTDYQVQHQCETTRTDDGFGKSIGITEEIFAQVKIVQIG